MNVSSGGDSRLSHGPWPALSWTKGVSRALAGGGNASVPCARVRVDMCAERGVGRLASARFRRQDPGAHVGPHTSPGEGAAGFHRPPAAARSGLPTVPLRSPGNAGARLPSGAGGGAGAFGTALPWRSGARRGSLGSVLPAGRKRGICPQTRPRVWEAASRVRSLDVSVDL